MSIIVKNQSEFDAAVEAGHRVITISSEPGVRVEVATPSNITVRASESATVWAFDSSTVTAYESSTVTAYGSATVQAHGSATVTAKRRVAIHLHSTYATIDGGVLIDHTNEPQDGPGWCEWHDVEVTDGIATLYKAVNDEWTTDRGFVVAVVGLAIYALGVAP